MIAFFAEKFDLTFNAINVFSSRDLDSFSVDKSINNLLSCLLEVVPESFPGCPMSAASFCSTWRRSQRRMLQALPRS